MPSIAEIPPEILKIRHRLSQQQIDELVGKTGQDGRMEEKIGEMVRVSEFLYVTDIFKSGGLKFISFKGPLLSYRLYKDATWRQYNDFDFLFDVPSSEKAIEILLKRGYVTPYYKMPVNECRKEMLRRHINEVYLYHPEKNVSIEIHWDLFSYRITSQFAINEIISHNLTEIDFAGRSFTAFNPEFDLLYMVIHGGMHYFRRLKWLVDIKDFLKKIVIDENKFRQLTMQMNASRIVAICNEMLNIYFPGTSLLPSYFNAPPSMVRYAVHQIEIEKDEDGRNIPEYLKGLGYNLRAFPGIDYKLSLIQSFLFATDLASSTKIPCISLFYYIISPFYKLYRGFRLNKNI